MLPAPAVILATMQVSDHSDRPACSADAITETSPAHEGRCASANVSVNRAHPSGSFALSTSWNRPNLDVSSLNTPAAPI